MRSILVPIICFLIVLATVMAQATEQKCSQVFSSSENESSSVVSSTAKELEQQDIDIPESMDRTGWRAAYARLVRHQWPMNEFGKKDEKPSATSAQVTPSSNNETTKTPAPGNSPLGSSTVSKAIPAKDLKARMDSYRETSERRSKASIERDRKSVV